MCGIAGYWSKPGAAEASRRIVGEMCSVMRHRGPDDHGSWYEAETGIALGHRRLSILDLSPLGHQPMTSRNERFCISYNGEIYNFKALRCELEALGASFRGNSDTEVLVEAIARWGVRNTLPKLVGMFAFALWDRREKRLSLVRDRLGIKPLYYGSAGDVFIFGSDLACLEAHPSFQRRLDRDALALFLRFQYVPAPHSIYKDTFKLPPGHFLELDDRQAEPRVECWWSAESAALDARSRPLEGSAEDAVDETESCLRQVVRDRMVSDVPLGAFLSGGIDSSTVVAIMQSESELPVATFTIGFREDTHDEASHARAISKHLGTKHTELYVTEDEAREVIPELPSLWTEPFADSSQLPTYLVSRLARQSVTVSLSGDGGDELFGGYNRYGSSLDEWARISRLPAAVRSGMALLGNPALRPVLSGLGQLISPLLASRRPSFDLADSIAYRASRLRHRDIDSFYRSQMSAWAETNYVIPESKEPTTLFDDTTLRERMPDPLDRMMIIDTLTYLPGAILEKVDRASMGVSLEARVPLLDHRLYDLAWRLPPDLRVRGGVTKWPLREVLARFVPRELFDRPKQGFGAPVASWLRGPLRGWAEALLEPKRIEREGVFSSVEVSRMWNSLLSERAPGGPIWNVLMFQAWLEARNGRVLIE